MEPVYRNLIRLSDGSVTELKIIANSKELGKMLNEAALKAAGYIAIKKGKDIKGCES